MCTRCLNPSVAPSDEPSAPRSPDAVPENPDMSQDASTGTEFTPKETNNESRTGESSFDMFVDPDQIEGSKSVVNAEYELTRVQQSQDQEGLIAEVKEMSLRDLQPGAEVPPSYESDDHIQDDEENKANSGILSLKNVTTFLCASAAAIGLGYYANSKTKANTGSNTVLDSAAAAANLMMRIAPSTLWGRRRLKNRPIHALMKMIEAEDRE